MNMRAAPPEFAMSFTQEAVLLEQRQGLGWRPLGEAPFAGGGMKATLRALRAEAGVADQDSETLLVIPDDQILYTLLTVPVGSDTPLAIGRTLEAMTPYRAEDLVFDWCPAENGDIETLRVAAVARRTLEEAEDFARNQGFRPSGFTARPGDERFDGQPDFGASLIMDEVAIRQPFSEPDLSLAGITAPQIPAAPDEIATPEIAGLPVSRIIPHVPSMSRHPARAITAAPAPQTEITEDDPDLSLPAAPVIRHGERRLAEAPDPLQHLSPRAQAFHARAQQGRTHRHDEDEDQVGTPARAAARWSGYRPRGMTLLAGGLFLGVLLMLAVFGTAPQPATELATHEARQAEAASATPSVPAAAPETRTAPDPAVTETATVAPQDVVTTATGAAIEIVTAPGDDSLSRALAEAMGQSPTGGDGQPAPVETSADAQRDPRPNIAARPISAATMLRDELATPPPSGTLRDGDTAQAEPTPAPVTAAATNPARNPLARSARPPRAAPERAAAPANPDSRPAVPGNPLPFEQRGQAEPSPVTGIRPPNRPAAAPAAPETDRPSPADEAAAPASSGAMPSRPPARPRELGQLEEEGSRSETDQPTRLSQAERAATLQLLQDLRTAQAGSQGLSPAERGAMIRLADARPTRKPVSVSGPSQQAVRDALAQAVETSDRPATRTDSAGAASGSDQLARSARPAAKPGAATARPASASLSKAAVESAIASAVSSSTAMPGAVALTALTTSALPPRRAASAIGNAVLAAAPTAPSSDDLRAAAAAQTAERDAALAEQRRIDAELQSQAEARARAFAAQDAAAEARARAQAEARARAQAEAEARAAAASKRNYTPPEAENEPEMAATSVPDGRTATTAAATATVKDGIQISRTQIIGTIGAGKASRALVRLSSGKIITLRLGDKINGGTISEIGNSQITFVRAGRPQQLSVLNGQ
jgi:hypothetical protein